MRGEMNSNRYEISFGWKSYFGVQSAFYLCSHELWQSKTKTGMDFISVILTEMKFQSGMRFSCEQNLTEAKWISAYSLDIAFNTHVRLKNFAGVISLRSFSQRWNFISGDKYHVNTTRHEMPTHVHQNIGSFWNAVGMKRHINRVCFHAGLKSSTGRSSFRLSYERTLSYWYDTLQLITYISVDLLIGLYSFDWNYEVINMFYYS